MIFRTNIYDNAQKNLIKVVENLKINELDRNNELSSLFNNKC